MPWYLYFALKQLFPTGKRLPFFTTISVAGVAAGVWLLVATAGVMGGFGEQYRKMILDTQGEVQVRGFGMLNNPKALQAKLDAVPGVRASTAFAEGVAMLEFERRPAFPAIQGIDRNRINDVVPLAGYVKMGSLDALDDDTVILSSGLARSIGANLGSKIELYSPLLLEKLKNDEVMLPRELRVAGIFQINHQQLQQRMPLKKLM